MSENKNEDPVSAFARDAEKSAPGVIGEFWQFLGAHKRWWLAPIVIALLLLGVLLVLGSTGAAPFIYTLF
jgi:hypothetical protein